MLHVAVARLSLIRLQPKSPADLADCVSIRGQHSLQTLVNSTPGIGCTVTAIMVCAKCQKLSKTTLATPGVKKKSEMYYGSPASSSSASKSSATLGQTGVSKSKLLSKGAKNPYAQYSSSCDKCKTKVSQGHKFCHSCAYKADACAMCGKSNSKAKTGAAPIISGQKFSSKPFSHADH
ncbi:hypothetical protein RB598_005566 [Gaeumannomyces tritici]